MSDKCPYLLKWTGDGAASGQAVPGFFPPGIIIATGIDPTAMAGILLQVIGPVGCVSNAGNVSSDLVPVAAGGLLASGSANLLGWTYAALVMA